VDARGKRQRRYPSSDYATPYAARGGAVKTNLALAQLDRGPRRMNDTECANRMASAKSKLLRIILYWKRILISGSLGKC